MASITLARLAVILPLILLINLLFAWYFLDLTDINLNPFSAPQPYLSLVMISTFYGCTLSLSMYLVRKSTTPSSDERKTLGLYVLATETALALFWSINVVVFTPAPVEYDQFGNENLYQMFWTDGRQITAVLLSFIAAIATCVFLITGERSNFFDLHVGSLVAL
jgi:hypothetical protein